jgi:hypothetical protein
MSAGDQTGDPGQRAMALAGVVEPVFEDGHGMDAATPFAHQPGAGLERDPWVEGAPFADQLDRLGHSAQPAPGSRAEPALRPLLHPIGDRPHQRWQRMTLVPLRRVPERR